MEKMRALGLGGVFVLLFSIILFLSPRFAHTMELDTDRPGMDYKSFDLQSPDPNMCERACKEDPQKCVAWTYVKPGIQGAKARCWLKSGVPSAVKNTCCVSGSMQQAQSPELLKQPVKPGRIQKMIAAPCAPLSFVSTSPLPSTGIGWDYKYQLQVSGGYAPIFFSVVEPPEQPFFLKWLGLTFGSDGIIQGQPVKAGYYVVTINAADSCPSGAQIIKKDFVIEVKDPNEPIIKY